MATRRFRGMGRARKTRRALAAGGTGIARRLNETVSGWSGVRITPTFGRWGYFVGDRLFACFPVREKERDLWIRLSREDQRRALDHDPVRPHRRFAGRGWVELHLDEPARLGLALVWLRRAHATALRDREG